ncbi:MAG: aminotransferase class III-fold pyridoxal phosphate-dependent enzyme [Flavobacteriaceae bacterium]|jgi:acetylornithine/N-succinyldiaminopimelate aminotransferase|nr:aminotransferase class III-fold pyridoxal phosphate-dependent enzyme [Flavobacteriaceae bacterium]MBT3753412.1 aminotransferase class III-fold pyridoxal phosphate-dependent enzyme [Flavobacteriaceae bacterium]MBT4062755.1 aminotransferase class III-fold pyridoxal phosphate-dependent enzyme [Flavobacteriaceae bacterium]MBT4415167.1 aminotransferase class III-fold pyridoxal phosphate-dependent enzyme [Flavobacteriaceae bacterium]MBT5012651.1 aminotransferase class III-fold pyridoxal phosphate-
MNLFNVYPLYEMTPSYAKMCYVYDKNGNKYLDLYGGHAVISIGHSHPTYVKELSNQLSKIGYYSNYIINDLQAEVAEQIINQSKCENYNLFMCNSGAEANENALQIASFHTNKSRVIAFKNSFHGRSNAALGVTDNLKIKSKLNKLIDVTFLDFNDKQGLLNEISKNDVSAVIFESIQGVGGLDEPETEFIKFMSEVCKNYKICLIVDEVQSGFGRTGDFFAYQKHDIKPDIICMAKGMGNGFPVGGVLIKNHIKSEFGMLGTTFGGNHLACTAVLAVLKTIKDEDLLKNSKELENYFREKISKIDSIKKIKGRGLMLGLEFEFETSELRKKLIFKHKIFTGGSANKNLLRILPPLNIKKKHIDMLYNALKIELS